MQLNAQGQLSDEPKVRIGFIGCGSHAFRNIYPTFQFAPIELIATCDLSLEKAQAFSRQFGAERAYDNHLAMLSAEELDAVFIVTNYDEKGRPRYPKLAQDCLQAGCHVWMEKPPAASCADLKALQQASTRAGRNVMVGLKKMFAPANQKARELSRSTGFGATRLVTLQYPQYIPTGEQFAEYFQNLQPEKSVVGFLDHIFHPVSLLVYLLGMPSTLYYERAANGAGAAIFNYTSGAVATLHLTEGAAMNGGLERTMIVSESDQHIVVDNNIRVQWHRPTSVHYGRTTSFFDTPGEAATMVWEPEFSLGQLYNKGLFLLGYFNEVNEFARSILEARPPSNGTLEQVWQVARIFEAFAEGASQVIEL
jgi:predicted dehydrogenase